MGEKSDSTPSKKNLHWGHRGLPYYPHKKPIYPIVPALPSDPDYGIIDSFYQARCDRNEEEMKRCIKIAMELGGDLGSASRLLGLSRQAELTRIRVRLGLE